ncbi:Mov34/MPN/PAD-1 family protein [Methanolobus zinderi]|uniref:Mov34/MPN/PAD-1 family protein n=1 Tax=Methanolobus zinderi TaxID=536044 RepID=A0A7D5E817_9EURY|nr:Mov34/MPN/PAD-1 family protein [Methanolobus zinderi]QLC50058.1 Mov34/MPN/PAD-1 family protein [Methanolobus zinderi]
MKKNTEIEGIARETLDFILEVSRSTYPNEFAGLLEAKDGIITDVLFLPGTESSESNAVLKLFMMPNISAVGSVHSHPSSVIRPSKADLRLFSKTGTRHIITGHPYKSKNWKCYDGSGEIVDLPVLDVELQDDDVL